MDMVKRAFRLIGGSRDFGLLLATQVSAQAGDGIVQAALAKFIAFGGQEGFDLEGARTPDELLRIALYIFIPYTILSPFFGVLIDRWDRRRLLFVVNGFRALVIAAIAVIGIGRVGDVALFGGFLLTLSATRVVLATKAAALPATLGGRDLVEGNGVSQLGGALFQIVGVGAALVASKFASVEPIVLTGAIVYAGGAATALLIRRAGEPRAKARFLEHVRDVLRSIARGVREVARRPAAAASITTYLWLRLLWSFSVVAIAFVARELLADDDLVVTALTGGGGAVGALLGFLLAHRLHTRARSTAHLVLGASAVAGLSVAILGPLRFTASLALLAFFLGLGFFLAKISLDTMVQEALGDRFRGRAFSLYDISYNVAWVLAAAVMKVFVDDAVPAGLIAGMGATFLVGLAGIAAWFNRAQLLAVAPQVDLSLEPESSAS